MVGALGSGPFLRYGKWNMILATNLAVLLNGGICMIDNSVAWLVGRFFGGLAAGCFTVFCPQFSAQLVPKEYRGPFGAINQFMCTFGIFLVVALGCPIPDDVTTLEKDSFLVQNYWRVVWGLPLVFMLIQVGLMSAIFKYDTPEALKQRADYDNLTVLLSKMYVKEQVQMRMDEIVIKETGHTNEDGNAELKIKEVTTVESFTNPVIRKAAWVGLALAVFQQLTGINAIMLYSSELFADSSSTLSANQQSTLVMAVNCAAACASSAFLNFAGRKTLMFIWTLACAVFLFLTAFATAEGWSSVELVMCMLFVAAFEFAPGPIVWLYNGEILNDKAINVACFGNWTFVLIIALTTVWFFDNLGIAGTFIMFGVCNLVAVIFIAIFMRETKGLAEDQVKKLYRTDRDIIGEFEEQLTKGADGSD